MAAIESLGRTIDVIPIAGAQGFSLRDCAGVLFVCTGTDTFTLTVATSFAGAYSAPGTLLPFTRKYVATGTNGTGAWVRTNQAASNVFTGTGTTAVYLDGNSLPDGFTYAKLTATGAGLVTAILGDLDVQRAPQNLRIKGA